MTITYEQALSRCQENYGNGIGEQIESWVAKNADDCIRSYMLHEKGFSHRVIMDWLESIWRLCKYKEAELAYKDWDLDYISNLLMYTVKNKYDEVVNLELRDIEGVLEGAPEQIRNFKYHGRVGDSVVPLRDFMREALLYMKCIEPEDAEYFEMYLASNHMYLSTRGMYGLYQRIVENKDIILALAARAIVLDPEDRVLVVEVTNPIALKKERVILERVKELEKSIPKTKELLGMQINKTLI